MLEACLFEQQLAIRWKVFGQKRNACPVTKLLCAHNVKTGGSLGVEVPLMLRLVRFLKYVLCTVFIAGVRSSFQIDFNWSSSVLLWLKKKLPVAKRNLFFPTVVYVRSQVRHLEGVTFLHWHASLYHCTLQRISVWSLDFQLDMLILLVCIFNENVYEWNEFKK